jgi:multiple sugar transport system permease protein
MADGKTFIKKLQNPLKSAPYLMIAPAILVQFTLVLYPLVIALVSSFQSWYMPHPEQRHFVGLQNYIKLITSPEVANAAWVTLKFMVLSVIGTTLLGLVIGLLLASEFRGVSVFRSLLIIPMMVTPAVSALLWIQMWHGSYGVINAILGPLGLAVKDWKSFPTTALWTIVVPDVWQWTPFVMLVVLGGMQSLPVDVFEAARVDGAYGWKMFRRITFPLLLPFLSTAVLFKLVYTLRVYALAWLITRGGPGTSTEIMSIKITITAFRELQIGKASALSFLVLFALIIIGTLLYKFFNKIRELGYS